MTELAHVEPTREDASPVVRARACPACGSPVEPYDKYCVACGTAQPGPAIAEAAPPKHFRCENCGAEVSIDPDQRSYTCAFCDSHYVVEFSPAETGRQAPEFVIGFAIAPDAAFQRFRQWLGRNGWFRPGDLRAAQIAEKLKGVYIPFWSFSTLARSTWSASIGEYWYRTETYTATENGKTVTKTRTVRETEWWSLSGGHHEYYRGYLVSGSRGLRQRDAERIKPFHLAALRRYEPYYLAGWLAEEYSVERDVALETSLQVFRQMERDAVAAFLPGDTYSDLRVETQFSDVGSDLILLPVYLLTYRYGNRLYRFLLNGQTGKAAGDKPLSGWRVGIAVAAALALGGLVWLLTRLL